MIFDMDKVGTKALWRPGLQMYLHIVKVMEDNYPEMMKQMFVVNGELDLTKKHKIHSSLSYDPCSSENIPTVVENMPSSHQ